MNETPTFIAAQLNDATKRMEQDGSTTYFDQVANRASSIVRKIGGSRRIVLSPFEPNGEAIVIDTSLRTVAYLSKPKGHIRFTTSATITMRTAEAINRRFMDIEKFAVNLVSKLK